MTARVVLPATIDTLFVLLVDKSYSMNRIRTETIIGMNKFIEVQKEKGVKNAYLCLYQFDDNAISCSIDTSFDMIPLENTRMLGMEDYIPRGGTPLFEAVGRTIDAIEESVEKAENPPVVVFQIITDGENNRLYRYSPSDISQKIMMLQEKGWTFTYAGADHDAWTAAQHLGITAGNTVQYAKGLVTETFGTMAAASAEYASATTVARTTDRSYRGSSRGIYEETGVKTTHLDK